MVVRPYRQVNDSELAGHQRAIRVRGHLPGSRRGCCRPRHDRRRRPCALRRARSGAVGSFMRRSSFRTECRCRRGRRASSSGRAMVCGKARKAFPVHQMRSPATPMTFSLVSFSRSRCSRFFSASRCRSAALAASSSVASSFGGTASDGDGYQIGALDGGVGNDRRAHRAAGPCRAAPARRTAPRP